MKRERIIPYYYRVQLPLIAFWEKYGTQDRHPLFIFGLGFDPRCTCGLDLVTAVFQRNEPVLFCACFRNLLDANRAENVRNSDINLAHVHKVARGSSEFHEYWVDMFSADGGLIGDQRLIREFGDEFSKRLGQFSDIIVDISAFPRSLMFSLLGYLWKKRAWGQNLFAVLTETPKLPASLIREADFARADYLFGFEPSKPQENTLWIPILGGDIERLDMIRRFLSPADICPILPFPALNPRLGDEIVMQCQSHLLDEWQVPYGNIMRASGEIPFDVYRKIKDIVELYRSFAPEISVVVSPLSGRSLSLGVLLAALWHELAVCHSQPATYEMTEESRLQLVGACHSATTTLYWLDGEIYEWEE